MISVSPDILDLGSDIGLRNYWFVRASYQHPAKLHLGLLEWIVERYTSPGDVILDPMAGVGSIMLAAALQRDVIAREIEPKWLAIAHENAAHIHTLSGLFAGNITVGQADAREPWGVVADAIVFSPPYSCRASSNQTSRHYVSHKTYQLAKANGISYTERWAQFVNKPSPGAAGAMTFFYGEHPAQIGHLRNSAYWQAMTDIYGHAYRSLSTCGVMVLIIKDHIRAGKHIHIADQTIDLCERLGFVLVERHYRRVYPLSLWQRRRKERGQPVIEVEDVIVLRRATA